MGVVFENFVMDKNLIIMKDWIYFEFSYAQKRFSFIGSLNSENKYLIEKKDGFLNDIDAGVDIKFINNYDDNVISWIDAYALKTHVSSETFKNATPKYPEKKKELEKLANSINENDNPVLMLVKLKD
jgi:hypothetical protein